LSYASRFIKLLSEKSDRKFFDFIRENYTSIFDVSEKAYSSIKSIFAIEDFGLFDLFLDITKKFVDKKNERHSLTRIIERYLEAYIKNEKMLVIFDNFTLCDKQSLDILQPILKKYCNDANKRFILVTTAELLSSREDILLLLSEKLDVERISIKAFASSKFFIEILSEIYDLDLCDFHDIRALFEICEGYPQRLKSFLINLYSQEGIDLCRSNKAILLQDKFKEHLLKKLINFDYNSLKAVEKYLVQIIAAWGSPIDIPTLNQFIAHVTEIDPLYLQFSREVISQTVLELENRNIIERRYDAGRYAIQFRHDSIYQALSALLREQSIQVYFLHYNMYYFLMKMPQVVPEREHQSLSAFHAHLGNCDGWEEVNLAYGKRLHESQQYAQAQKVFDRLGNEIHRISAQDMLMIAENCYHSGNYQKAKELADKIAVSNLNTEGRYQYDIYCSKIAMILGDYERAVAQIRDALLREHSEEQRVELVRLKLVALCLFPNGYEKSKKEFDSIMKEYDNTEKESIIQLIYKDAVDYYRGSDAFYYLNKGRVLAEQAKDWDDWAKITHNMGFEHFRCGEYQKARELFQDSMMKIQELKPHEVSYCLNDLAVIDMMEKQYDNAVSTLREAYFWNKSFYAELAIKGNLMLCYHFQGQHRQAESLAQELSDYLVPLPKVDDKLYKKIYTNVAIVYMASGRRAQAKALLKRCIPYLKTESSLSSARVYHLLELLQEHVMPQKTVDPRYADYYYRLPFEPWVVTFGNE
jgi:Flp pilus assembly protein TadD